MNKYHDVQPLYNTDSIERAVQLIKAGAVTPIGEGRFQVRGDCQGVGYTVSVDHCTCDDSEGTGQVCEHRWAAIGASAALLIHDIRGAETTGELEQVRSSYADAMRAMPEAYAVAAWKEYEAQECYLTGKGSEGRQIGVRSAA
jgi:hypothetical protein